MKANTMREVAEAAGVSVATVSRVLAGKVPVSHSRRRAVEEACDALGYQWDAIAAALRSGSTGSVGMLIPDVSNPFFPAIVQSFEHELALSGIDLLFCDANNDIEFESRRINALLSRRVDALLVCPVDANLSAPAIRAAAKRTRVIQFERLAIDDADFVGVDQHVGMSQIFDHFRKAAIASAAFLGLQPEVSTIAERASAFFRECRASGVRTRPALQTGALDLGSGRAMVRELIDQGELPSALVCANDQLAFGVLSELSKVGYCFPEQLLVVGHDDVPAAELLGLSTVRQPLVQLGKEAARLLKQPSDIARHVRLAPSFVPRMSTTTSELYPSSLAWR